MAVIINGNGIDMGNSPISNASQIDGVVINENNENVATTSNLVGFKNYTINGNFDIWQRGVSQESSTDAISGYGSDDRWINQFSGTYRKHYRVACSDTERILFNSAYFSRSDVVASTGAGDIVIKNSTLRMLPDLRENQLLYRSGLEQTVIKT